jgi:Type II secretion system (T2SS), protein E, N-terminal domain
MASTLTPSEEAQLAQTVEMFEVITQSQPQDYQSLEILKEAYSKLGRETDVIGTSKRIAQAYVQMGQLSSAILEYETVLQRHPSDKDVQAALKEIESKANNFPIDAPPEPAHKKSGDTITITKSAVNGKAVHADVEDGRRTMHKLFVESKVITQGDFDLCWPSASVPPAGTVVEPFVQVLADKGILPMEKSLKLLADKSRFAYLALPLYDIDIELARTFPAATCQRWCVLPFDRMSKSVLVATANPFNQQATRELSAASPNRLLWYLVSPVELTKIIRKTFR